MLVLVDTSVWIRFLANKAPYASELDGLLERDEVAGHDLIYGELLIGGPAGRRELLTSYEVIEQLSTVAHTEVVAFVRTHSLQGRGIGWIDAQLLASALVSGIPLWTADRRLSVLAAELGIGYVPNST